MAGAAVLAVGLAPGAQSPAGAQGAPTVTTQVVTSFDGTPILTTLFVPAGATAADPAPLVLQTHGWGGTGQRTATGFVSDLLDAGYVVLTWDQRGFGCSGGEVTIDKPELEGRDASALIDWAVANSPVKADGDGDPVVGMTGGSYAGGIQTATAAFDDRIDAIAPEISWHDLRYSLYAGQVVNQGWATLLYAAGLPTATGLGLDPRCPTFPQAGGLDARITEGFVGGATTGTVSPGGLEFFAGSSLAAYGDTNPVAIPTLVVQGSVDTLFDLTDGYRIFQHVRAQGAPARFVIFCGGHVACPESYGTADDANHVDAAVLDWFARYLLGDTMRPAPSTVEYRTNEGVWRQTDDFPPAGSERLTAQGSGSLLSIPILELPDPSLLAEQLAAFGGGIPATPLTAAQVSASGDGRSMTVEVASAEGGPLELLGIPEVELEVSGTGTEVILMAKLVDREAARVVNLQEGAIRVPLGGGPAAADVPMPGIAYTLPVGHHLDLQVSTASLMHSNARLPAQVEVEARVSVPAQRRPAAGPSDLSVGPSEAPGTGPTGGQLPATGTDPEGLPLVVLAAGLLLWRARAAGSRRP